MQGHISFAKNAMHKSLATTATQKQKKRGIGGATMAEYIERAEVLKKFEEIKSSVDITFADALYLDGVMELIDSVPSADVVEAVRCKDCKWHDSVDGPTAKIEQLQSELEQVKRERDAAVNEIKACYDIQGIDDYYPIYDLGICMCCSHYSDVVDRANGEELACYDCQNASNWQWRGVKEDNRNETD